MNQLKYVRVNFKKGSLLTADMLSAVEAVPHEILSSLYSCDIVEGDEVVHGLDFTKGKHGELWLSGGIVRYGGDLYILPSPVNLDMELSRCESTMHYVLILKRLENSCDNPIEEKGMEVSVEVVGEAVHEGVILAHFMGNDPVFPNSLSELLANYRSCFNVWRCEYSFNGKKAVHPMIARMILRSMQNRQLQDQYDFSLIQALLSAPTVTADLLLWYCKGKSKGGEFSKELFREKKMLAVLKEYVEPIVSQPLHRPEKEKTFDMSNRSIPPK